MKTSKFRSLLWRASVMLLVAVPLTVLWGELFTRILLPQNLDSKMDIYAVDPVIGFIYQPGARAFEKGREYNVLYEINRVGLRDRDYGPKGKQDFRVLLLGDSFAASHGLAVEDSLSRQMEKALQTAVDRDGMPIKIEVINAAVGGYSPYNYWKAYQRWAPVVRPDVIIVGLSPDDHDCSNEDCTYIIKDGALLGMIRKGEDPPVAQGRSVKEIRKWLSWNSQFYVLLRNFIYYNDLVGQISRKALAKEMQRNQLPRFLTPQPQEMERAWAKTFAYLRQLRIDAANDAVEMIVIPIPSKVEIDPMEYRRVLDGSGLSPDQLDIHQPLRQITLNSKKEGIPLLDPSAAIRQRHTEVPCYFVYDGHWIAEGIRTAADSIAMQWRTLGLRPWNKAFLKVENRSGEALPQISGHVDAH